MIIVIAFLWVSLMAAPAYAAPKKVSVKTVDYPVLLNGIQLSNRYLEELSGYSTINYSQWHAQYPLLEYKSITYVPMDWACCSLLNLNVSWSQGSGLDIKRGNPDQWKHFMLPTRNTKNASRQSASIVDFPVTVNGKPVENEKEPYPLLVFRDITYFPLTWRFAVEEFGWRYFFSMDDGLRIEADNCFRSYEEFLAPDQASSSPPLTSRVCFVRVRGDTRIWIEHHIHKFPWCHGVFVSQGGEVSRLVEPQYACFGNFEDSYFRVEDGWMYAKYSGPREGSADGTFYQEVPARVNIQTKEMQILE